jgi:hypothetical protein
MKRLSALLLAILPALALLWCQPAHAQAPLIPGDNVGGRITVSNSASGTTAAVVATLPALAGRSTYLCGFSYQGSDATAGQVGVVAVTNVTGGTMNFAYPTLALGATVPQPGPLTVTFTPCLAATAQNTTIVVTGPALGAGATVATVNAWGYQYSQF